MPSLGRSYGSAVSGCAGPSARDGVRRPPDRRFGAVRAPDRGFGTDSGGCSCCAVATASARPANTAPIPVLRSSSEPCPSGRRCNSRKVVWVLSPPWVQIPPVPPEGSLRNSPSFVCESQIQTKSPRVFGGFFASSVSVGAHARRPPGPAAAIALLNDESRAFGRGSKTCDAGERK